MREPGPPPGTRRNAPSFVYLLGRSGAVTERKIGISNFPDDRTARSERMLTGFACGTGV